MEQTIAPSATSYSWSETSIKAVTQPTVETYEAITGDPQASRQRALSWVALAALVAYVLESLPLACVAFAALALLAPGIGDIFSNTIEGMQ